MIFKGTAAARFWIRQLLNKAQLVQPPKFCGIYLSNVLSRFIILEVSNPLFLG
jgi:hypothetical protein